MNQSEIATKPGIRVWLPPDGDARLVRFQADVALATGHPEAEILPPYLPCESPAWRPSGPLRLGTWGLTAGVPVLEVWDSSGPVGALRFVLDGEPPWSAGELEQLPSPPSWTWTRGRLATLTIERSPDGVILWSWAQISGWKSNQPKE